MVWDSRFELLTSRTPCVRATGLRQSQMPFRTINYNIVFHRIKKSIKINMNCKMCGTIKELHLCFMCGVTSLKVPLYVCLYKKMAP